MRLIKQWHVSIVLFISLIIISISGIIDLLTLIIVCLFVLTCLRILDLSMIIDHCLWKVYLLLVLSHNIGVALSASGLDQDISSLFQDLSIHLTINSGTSLLILIILGLITVTLTVFSGSATSVSVMLPIAYQIAKTLSLPISPSLLYITAISNVDLMTHFGYQTNLMIQSTGQYRCLDYLKLGSIITAIYLITLTLMTYAIGIR